MHIFLIFLGGGLGAVSRYGLSLGIDGLVGMRFPLGIFVCNVLGCFLIGLFSVLLGTRLEYHYLHTPFLLTGFLGGFTTFSTFSLDNHKLVAEGLTHMALINILASIAGALCAVYLGSKVAARSF